MSSNKFSDHVYCFEKLAAPVKAELKALIEGAGASVVYMMSDKVFLLTCFFLFLI